MPMNECITHTFEHAWEEVSTASWQKYPSDARPDVLSVDLIDRSFDPESGILKSTRLVIMEDKLPRFLQPIFGNNKCIVVESSEVNIKTKVMVLKSRNISFQNIVKIEETCTYTQNENPSWTDFKQEAVVHAYPFGVSGNIEKFLTGKFVRNAPLGREIMEDTVQDVKEENIMKTTFANLVQETLDCAASFEQRFDSFKEDLSLKVKEREEEIVDFYNECKQAGTEWASDRMQQVEEFVDQKFDELFKTMPVSSTENVLKKQ